MKPLKPTILILLLALVLIGPVLAADPPHYARSDRYVETTRLHGDTLKILVNAADRDTTATEKQTIHDCKNWRLPIGIVAYCDSVSGKSFCDTTIFQYRVNGARGWGSWTTIDMVFAKGVAAGLDQILTFTQTKPVQIQARAVAAADSGDHCIPHFRFITE